MRTDNPTADTNSLRQKTSTTGDLRTEQDEFFEMEDMTQKRPVLVHQQSDSFNFEEVSSGSSSSFSDDYYRSDMGAEFDDEYPSMRTLDTPDNVRSSSALKNTKKLNLLASKSPTQRKDPSTRRKLPPTPNAPKRTFLVPAAVHRNATKQEDRDLELRNRQSEQTPLLTSRTDSTFKRYGIRIELPVCFR